MSYFSYIRRFNHYFFSKFIHTQKSVKEMASVIFLFDRVISSELFLSIEHSIYSCITLYFLIIFRQNYVRKAYKLRLRRHTVLLNTQLVVVWVSGLVSRRSGLRSCCILICRQSFSACSRDNMRPTQRHPSKKAFGEPSKGHQYVLSCED